MAVEPPPTLSDRYRRIRSATEVLCAPLSPEDMVVQSMADCSPAKWHLAHTTWFFETFILSDPALGDYQPFNIAFNYLFNSYYDAIGPRHPRPQRGLLTRPDAAEVYRYRAHVDAAMQHLLSRLGDPSLNRFAKLIELGLNHEQQHQELLLTDIKHVFGQNPILPAYADDRPHPRSITVLPLAWMEFPAGVHHIGHEGDGFAFDNECPRHRVFLEPFAIAVRPITCGEYMAFVDDMGYTRPELWLSDGWQVCRTHNWTAPLYWEWHGSCFQVFTLGGTRPLDPNEPVCHLSFYEADAFARWAAARLPTETEWEVSCGKSASFVAKQGEGRVRLHPASIESQSTPSMLGEVWEWTQSAYGPYPGYRPATGPVGEYNGKFMCNQIVLRGGSCLTPRSHLRPTYRNFFPPEARWQFTGLRLALNLKQPGAATEFRDDVITGLTRFPKELSCKYFYDERGSQLFDRICDLPEYYLTRTELAIMHADAMAEALGRECRLIEYGSGSSIKTPLLLEAMENPAAYVPVDISGEHLLNSAWVLSRRFPWLDVTPVVADFTKPFDLPPSNRLPLRDAIYFPGSTIGNFVPADAVDLMRAMVELVGEGGALLIGVDLRKPVEILERAYNDRSGVTAAFNLNLLARINAELGGDFDLNGFEHRATFNERCSRIEMHLFSRREQNVHIGRTTIAFIKGESIRTEYSHKYTREAFRELAAAAGAEVREVWTDANQMFSVQYLTVGCN